MTGTDGTESATALRLAGVVLDCPDPRELAGFYAELLGWRIDEAASQAGWVELADPHGGAPLCFQLDPDFQPPTWPSGERPQMAHLDVRVAQRDVVEEHALRLGAHALPQPLDQRAASFRVFADPAGHPFCLCA